MRYNFTERWINDTKRKKPFQCDKKSCLRNSSNSKEENESYTDSKEVQANKSTGRMPWHQEPMKDVTSCDKLRLAANKRMTRRFPNEETLTVKNRESCTEYIGV